MATGAPGANGWLPPGKWRVWVSAHPSGKELVALEGTIGGGPSSGGDNAVAAPTPLHMCDAALGYEELRVSITLGDGSWGPFVARYPNEGEPSDSPARARVFEVVLGTTNDVVPSAGHEDGATESEGDPTTRTSAMSSGVQFSIRECP
jgi:hypothetical protein